VGLGIQESIGVTLDRYAGQHLLAFFRREPVSIEVLVGHHGEDARHAGLIVCVGAVLHSRKTAGALVFELLEAHGQDHVVDAGGNGVRSPANGLMPGAAGILHPGDGLVLDAQGLAHNMGGEPYAPTVSVVIVGS